MEKFRRIFVQEPAKKDLSALTAYSEDIRYLTAGFEDHSGLAGRIEDILKEFNPDTDAVIPVGRVVAAFILGAQIAAAFPGKDISIGLYNNKDYTFMRLSI